MGHENTSGLDSYDRAIVAALQENGRYTVQELAARIGLST